MEGTGLLKKILKLISLQLNLLKKKISDIDIINDYKKLMAIQKSINFNDIS